MPLELHEGAIVASRYRLDRLIGKGGFAVVWAATHVVTRKRFALKFLSEVYASDARIRHRFLREARAASAVCHPSVIVIYDVFEEDGRPVMVMDLLEGESLGDRLERDRALPLNDVATIMLPVISALETAHDLGIVHRDLKPHNIFLAKPIDASDAAIEVKVLDFGIAKLTAQDGDAAQSAGLTKSGVLLGTPFYMSPEQVFSEDTDQRSDIWAIAVILYECLAGVRPTQAETVALVIRKIIANESITPLEHCTVGLPAEVASVVMRALSFDRAKRPALRELGEVFGHYTSVKMPSLRRNLKAGGERGASVTAGAPGFEPSGALDGSKPAGKRDGRATTQESFILPAYWHVARRIWPAVAIVAGPIVAMGIVFVARHNMTSTPAAPAARMSFPPPLASPSGAAPPATTVASVPPEPMEVRRTSPLAINERESLRDAGPLAASIKGAALAGPTRPDPRITKTVPTSSATARPIDPGSVR